MMMRRKLGLEIGDADKDDSPVKKHGICMFTAVQLHELQQQALIFKYIAAGLPVPPCLVFPLWKSLAISFGSDLRPILRQFPTFVGFTAPGFDLSNLMDPEPWRCRRTDGKKWRCGRHVVSGQKYCEGHMHRGRQRSRKPVEASQTAASSDKLNLLQDIQGTVVTRPNNSTKLSENAYSNRSNQTSVSPQQPVLSLSNTGADFPTCSSNGDLKITGLTMALTADEDLENTSTTMKTSTTVGLGNNSKTIISAETANSKGTYNKNKRSRISIDKNGIDGWSGSFSSIVGCKNTVHRSSNKRSKDLGNNLSRGLDFSPKSVLQVQGCSDLDLEPGRCRRTDGKKWRCRRDVVTNQKYCGMHMHRGAKKHSKASEAPDFPTASAHASSSSHRQSEVLLVKKADCTNLNTDLSISIPTSPPLTTFDHANTSSSSDATISDTISCTHRT